MYGTQAVQHFLCCLYRFENDVKMYGTQAMTTAVDFLKSFENDVKMYGTQAGETFKAGTYCLRMM